MWESIREKLSVEYVKTEILKTAYGNRETIIARLDPRVLLVWYIVFALVPWFFYNKTTLIGFCVLTAAVTALTRVSSLILFMLAFGVIGDVVGWGVSSLLFGGDLTVFWSLSTLILKLLSISLASIAVFSSMDPDRFSDALLSLGMPDQFAFGISYGYRMVPILLAEYHNIVNAYRLRGKEPDKTGFLYWRRIAHFLRLIVRAFYPMILNTAKRMRTTVEGLEIKGYTYALDHPEVKRLKLGHLRIQSDDVLFLAISTMLLMGVIALGKRFPL
jgi:energy-coupling factor transport system permease protein